MRVERARYTARCIETKPDPVWDARVEAAPGGDLAQTTLWATSRQRLGFRSLHVTITDSHGAMAGACIVYAKRLAPGFWAASMPRGPLLFAAPSEAPAVLRQIVAVLRKQGIGFLVIQPPEGAESTVLAMRELGFRPGVPSVAPEATLRLDLRRDDDELLRAMNSNRRRDIQKALRANFTIREETDISAFHRLNTATAERQGFDPVTLENLKAQWESLSPHRKCAMFVARYNDVPVAAIWLTCFADTVTYKLAGWDAAVAAPPNASDALQWNAIQWARAQGAHSYDFGGFDRSAAELLLAGKPLTGNFHQTPSFFKQRFGGTPVLLPRAQFLFTSRPINLALGPVVQRLFAGSGLRRLANQLRNGQLAFKRRRD